MSSYVLPRVTDSMRLKGHVLTSQSESYKGRLLGGEEVVLMSKADAFTIFSNTIIHLPLYVCVCLILTLMYSLTFLIVKRNLIIIFQRMGPVKTYFIS